jgi:phosphate transport system substrate-binding protein
MIVLSVAIAATALASPSFPAGRDKMSIVGSSTVYPFATIVAEQFGKGGKFKTPTVESTGTGGGIKLFCRGVGPEYPDIVNASRPIKGSEVATCERFGVNEIVEIKIGYDGIVLAQAKRPKPMRVTRKDLYLALAKVIPDPSCIDCDKLIDNPYTNWNEVNSSLPASKIQVFGPPPTSGTRDVFEELVMEPGCHKNAQGYAWLRALKAADDQNDFVPSTTGDEVKYKRVCQQIREDGAYIEAGENDQLIIQKLVSNPNAVGVFGYSFLEENLDKVSGVVVEGSTPDFDSISTMSYPISRALFFYVKKAHIGSIPGITEYIAEFTSEQAWGDGGYLAKKGFIPMPADEREEIGAVARRLTPMPM